jgi:outer membrane protein assembly factor BamC
MNIARISVLALLAVLVTACESVNDYRYADSSVGQSLELPPDLAGVQVESKFELPAAISGDDETAKDKIPVLAKVQSVQLEGSGDLYWLQVDESVDNLYQIVKNFWASEGYRLNVDEPVIGVMQTEWIYKSEGGEEESSSWLGSLFTTEDLSATQDQFKTRIERSETNRLNRVYIAHRGTEYKYVLRTDGVRKDEINESDWNFRQPEPELEIEMLARLMIYLGLQQAAVEQQRENVKLFKPRASLLVDADESSPYLLINNVYQIAWNRVFHQLERMNFEIISSEFKSGISGEGVIFVKAPTVEIESSGGFFNFQSQEKEGSMKFTLVFFEETNQSTRLILEDEKGEFDTSPAGSQFLNLLYQKIK